MRLLILLLYYGEKGIPRQKVLDILYGDSEPGNDAGNLRAVAFRLKKQMAAVGLLKEEENISERGVFRWIPRDLEIHVDVREFEQIAGQAVSSAKSGMWGINLEGEDSRKLLGRACRLYTGEFLPELAADMWVAGIQSRCQELYFQCVRLYLKELEQAGDYEEMLTLVRDVNRMYPYEEWFIAELDVLIDMGRWREALEAAGQSTKILMEKIGIRPTEGLMERIHQINLHIKGSSKNLLEIREELEEKDYETGAYYCDYASFIVTYRCEIRKIERNGQSLYLVLCTITEKDGSLRLDDNDEHFENMAEKLSGVIRSSLRRTDVYTRYGKNQFLMILAGLKQEDCSIVYARIDRNFSRIPGAGRYRLNYFMVPVTGDTPHRQNLPLRFGSQNW